MDPVFRIHIGFRDEVQVGNQLVEFRIRHALQASPYFGLPVVEPPVSRPVGLFGTTVHGDHLGAWTASGKWA